MNVVSTLKESGVKIVNTIFGTCRDESRSQTSSRQSASLIRFQEFGRVSKILQYSNAPLFYIRGSFSWCRVKITIGSGEYCVFGVGEYSWL
jgi:hypothetical protein